MTNLIAPAMQFMPLLAISPRFFQPLYSRYHSALLQFDTAAACLIPYQHFTFIPLLMVAKFGELDEFGSVALLERGLRSMLHVS